MLCQMQFVILLYVLALATVGQTVIHKPKNDNSWRLFENGHEAQSSYYHMFINPTWLKTTRMTNSSTMKQNCNTEKSEKIKKNLF